MENTTLHPGLAIRFHQFFSQARFFTVSLFVHVMIIVFGGSYVMIQRMEPAPDFVATDGPLVEEGEHGPVLDERFTIQCAVPTEKPSPGVPSTPASAVIGTIANSTGFEMNFGGTTGIDLGKAVSGSKGITDPSGLAGSLTKRMGKVGSTSMVCFLGQTAEVQAVVFVVDISGSMIMGKKSEKTYEKLEDEIKRVLRGLDARTRFGIVAFSGEAHLYREQLELAQNDEKQRAINWLRKQSPVPAYKSRVETDKKKHSGTRADKGLEAAFKLEPDTIFFVSDGEPTGAPPAAILKLVTDWQKGRQKPVAINAVAYLADSGEKFMGDLAKQNSGNFREVNPKDARHD